MSQDVKPGLLASRPYIKYGVNFLSHYIYICVDKSDRVIESGRISITFINSETLNL